MYSFDVCESGTHAQQSTPADTTTVRTFLPPAQAGAFFVTVTTTAGFMTLDGSTPGSGNGIPIATGAQPLFVPCAPVAGVKFTSQSAAICLINILWLR